MATLILLRGYSGSGKSTIAKAWVAEAPNERMRVNRDDLRSSLFGIDGVLSPSQEDIITKVQRAATLTALQSGKSVIVDDTNLRAKFARYWADLAAANGFLFMVQDVHVDVEECIRRNNSRIHYGMRGVPEEVIRNQAARFPRPWPNIVARPVDNLIVEPVEHDPSLPSIVLCDIDGTVAHMADRSPSDWSRVGEDIADDNVIDLVWIMRREGLPVIFFSGRDAVCREETLEWLEREVGDVKGENLFMRPEGDNRKDSIIKLELFNENIRGKYNVKYVLDDRNQVVEMWRALGLTCLAVAPGDF